MRERRAKAETGIGLNVVQFSDYHHILADLFHLLSQPLTGLGCSLALPLNQVRPRWGRRELEVAYEQVHTITRLNASIRALIDTDDPGGEEGTGAAVEILAELVDELKPVAEAKQVKLCLTENAPVSVRLGAEQLRRAIFYLLDFAVHVSAKKSRTLLANQAEAFTICLTPDRPIVSDLRNASGSQSSAQRTASLKWRLPLAIARKMLENAGAKFQAEWREGLLTLSFDLPPAQEAIQPLTAALRRPA